MTPWRVREVYLFWTNEPDYWEDITCCMDTRIAALLRHASQVGAEPEKLVERIRQRARERARSPAMPPPRRSNGSSFEASGTSRARQSSCLMKPARHPQPIYRERVRAEGIMRNTPSQVSPRRGLILATLLLIVVVAAVIGAALSLLSSSPFRAPASERRRRLLPRPLRRVAGPAWRSHRRKASRGRASSLWAAAGGRAIPWSSGWRRRAPRTPRSRRWPLLSCRIRVNSRPASPTRTTVLGTCCRLCKSSP